MRAEGGGSCGGYSTCNAVPTSLVHAFGAAGRPADTDRAHARCARILRRILCATNRQMLGIYARKRSPTYLSLTVTADPSSRPGPITPIFTYFALRCVLCKLVLWKGAAKLVQLTQEIARRGDPGCLSA